MLPSLAALALLAPEALARAGAVRHATDAPWGLVSGG
jgi:hypothetical protein